MSLEYDDLQIFGQLGDAGGFGNHRVLVTDAQGNAKLTQAPSSGDQLFFNGTLWTPKSILNEFSVFPIWAEENGGLANGQYEWSWGNGAVGADIGIPLGLTCELFALSLNCEVFGTSVSIDVERDGATVQTVVFTNNNENLINAIPIPFTVGQRLNFRTNTVVGTNSDARICAWFRVQSTASFPTADKKVVSNSNVAFTSAAFADIPGMTTTISLSDTGIVDAIVNYSALRSGTANAVTQFRVVINDDNGQAFFDTLSTFNDNGSAAHFVENLPAGTYTVKAQALTDNPITITSIALTASSVEV